VTQIPPNNFFLVAQILQKSPQKVGNFPKKSYWDFLSIFSDDFFSLATKFGQIPPKIIFMVIAQFRKI